MSFIMAQHVLMVTILIVSLASLAKLVKDNNIFTMIEDDDEIEAENMEEVEDDECTNSAA